MSKYYLDRNELKVTPGQENRKTYLDKTLEKQNKGPFETALDNVRKPIQSKPKQLSFNFNGASTKTKPTIKPKQKYGGARQENVSERIERVMYETGETNKKPAHYDNPLIVDHENWKQPPRKMDNMDPTSYPSDRDQKQKISTWDLIVEGADTPEEKKQIRETLRDHYKNVGKECMTDKELRMIGRHPDQLKAQYTSTLETLKIPQVLAETDLVGIKKEPEIPVDQLIKQKADERLVREQQQYDKQWGGQGITRLFRPD